MEPKGSLAAGFVYTSNVSAKTLPSIMKKRLYAVGLTAFSVRPLSRLNLPDGILYIHERPGYARPTN